MRANPTRQLFAIVLLVAVAGCGDDPSGAGDEVDAGADAASNIADIAADGISAADTLEKPDIAATVDTGPANDTDNSALDSGSTEECPGGPECPCADNGECDNGICIETGSAKQCARDCVDQCKEGFACTPFSGAGGDNVLICAPTWDWACDPCSESAQCKKIGLEAAVCVDYGDDGGYCGVPCKDESTCPVGYACKQIQSVEGAGSKQCVRKGGEPVGLCTCSDAAKTKKLQTACKISHKDSKGQVTATCPGVRTCGDNGLTKCIGPAPSAEVCDGADNDCDGKTDEQSCEDNNACTADACDPSAAKDGKGGCKHSKLDGPCDADGSVCTESDKCDSGVCVPGKAKNCDDGNDCTLDICDMSTGCTQGVDDGKACDGDGNPCTVGDLCKAGSCAVGAPKVCASNDPCALAKCLPTTGKCAFSNKSDKTPCNDGSLCTSGDICDQGFCKGLAISCDDDNGCTADSCTDSKGCAHEVTAGGCNDNNACTSGDVCSGGACVGLAKTATACSDGNPCTKDSCDPGSAQAKGKGCVSAPDDGAPCDDGQICTGNDACKAGKCAAGGFVCACKSDADCAAKGDGNACNGILACDTSGAKPACKLNMATIISCKDPGKPCVGAQCQPKSGLCLLVPHKAGTSCDDNDSCTVGDACSGNNADDATCVPGKKKDCDDQNPCTTNTCSAKSGCASNVDKTYSAPCYTGPKATDGIGLCSKGKRGCKADATLGPCAGETLPAAAELCDGKDDDCDGDTDEGCGSVGWAFSQVGARLTGSGGKYRLDARSGVRVGGEASGGGKRHITWGLQAWISAWSAK